MAAEKQLLIRLVARADGQPAIAGFGRSLAELAHTEEAVRRETRETNAEMRRQNSLFGELRGSLGGWLAIIGGGAGIGLIARKTFEYNQELEGTQLAIAGLLYANSRYTDSLGNVVDSSVAFEAANAESLSILGDLQRESLKTAATVPQIADAFAIVYGALGQAGISADKSAVVQLTARLTQAAGAMKIPMDQIRQEINSLLTGQVTSDSTIAKRLGLDNASIKQMTAAGTLVAEIMQRTDGYAKASEAQANTVSSKLVNTIEVITATLSKAFAPLIEKSKGALDAVFSFFEANGERITTFVQRVVEGADRVITAIGKWTSEHKGLVEEILAIGAVALAAAAGYGIIAAAIAAITSPITLVIAGVVGLALLWEQARKYSEIEVGGRPIAAYVRAMWEVVSSAWTTNTRNLIAGLKALWEALSSGVVTAGAAVRLLANVLMVPGRILQALTNTANDAMQRVVAAFAPVGQMIARPVARVMQYVAQLRESFYSLIAAAEGPARRVAKAFDDLVRFVTTPLRGLLGIIASLPAKLIAIVPGAEAVRDAARDFAATLPDLAKPFNTISTAFARTRAESAATEKAIHSALATKDGLGSVADTVKGAWGRAAGWLDSQLPTLETTGKKAFSALGITSTPTNAGTVNSATAAKPKDRAQLQSEQDAYLAFITEYREKARAAGDPLSQALAKIETERSLAIAKLTAQREKLQGALGAAVFDADLAAINKVQDAKAAETRLKSLEGLKKDLIASLRLRSDLTLSTEREIEDRRLALIRNTTQRELAAKLTANRRWFEDESERITASIENETERINQIGLLRDELKRRDARDREDADREIRAATVGYAEYWQKLGDAVAAQWRSIGQIIADIVLESRRALSGAINGFLDDLASGQGDLLKSITGLAKGLTSMWTKALTEILVSGKNVSAQLKELFKNIQVRNGDGSTDYLGTALNGAGVGGMVGGLFQTPNNYAGVGGAVGGAIGAIIGTIWGGNTAIGAYIGTAIGTAIGSVIQKGKDAIKVRIAGGIAEVTEKGISAEAAREVETQIQRKVNEEMKSWQSIIDRFPQEVRDAVANLYSGSPGPTINISGGVESADLTDQGALGALSDFLSNDLPEGAFRTFEKAIRLALGKMGTGAQRINQLFDYFGTLQGKELHDAVERYVVVMLDAADLREKINAPFADKLVAARKLGKTPPLAQLDDITAAIDSAVTRMAGLKDVEDIVAAQEEVNRLSRQYYELQIQHLARIQQVQDSITASFAQQREQIELSGKSDQGKVDFFFARMLELRGELLNTTDEEEIGRLAQQIQQYVSQAQGIAADNPVMREKLLGILTDAEDIAKGQLDKARQEVADRDAKPASLLERASELLLKAAGDLADATNPDDGATDEGDGKEEETTPVRRTPAQPGTLPVLTPVIGDATFIAADMVAKLSTLTNERSASDVAALTAEATIARLRAAQPERAAGAPTAADIAAAIREVFASVEFQTTDSLVIDNGDLGRKVVEDAARTVIARFRDDPYLMLPRAA